MCPPISALAQNLSDVDETDVLSVSTVRELLMDDSEITLDTCKYQRCR